MRPFFFGGEPQLFGLHHPPEGASRGVSVVIAHPLPQEYMRTYWALRRLGAQLANEGFHVLRFDYRGTGDSAGDLQQASVDAWRADLLRAVNELRELSEGQPVSMVGVRLGGGLVLSTAGLELRDLVLWEPVLRGKPHVERLRALHRERHGADADAELLGYPWPRALGDGIESFDASSGPRCTARRTSVLENRAGDGASLDAERVALTDVAIAQSQADLNISLLAPAALSAIVGRLTRPIP